jgi:hypothetical protein
MRRLRLFRRRTRHEDVPEDFVDDLNGENEFQPFVPVSDHPDYSEYPDYDEGESLASEAAPDTRRRRFRLPRLRISRPSLRLPRPQLRRPEWDVDVRWGVLFVVSLLIAGGIFGTLLNQGRLRDEVEAWWPVTILILAGGWMLVALLQRQVMAFLGGAACAGVGLSFLMSTQDIAAVEETLLGMVLITIGLGVVIRGFLLRQRVPL